MWKVGEKGNFGSPLTQIDDAAMIQIGSELMSGQREYFKAPEKKKD